MDNLWSAYCSFFAYYQLLRMQRLLILILPVLLGHGKTSRLDDPAAHGRWEIRSSKAPRTSTTQGPVPTDRQAMRWFRPISLDLNGVAYL